MRIIKVLAIALFGIAVMTAMPVSAALAGTELVQTKGTSRALTVEGGEERFNSVDEFSCSSMTGTGTLQSAKDASILLQYHKCGSRFLSCTTAGEPAGLVDLSALVLFNRSHGRPLLLFAQEGTKLLSSFSCSGIPLEVKGSINGVVTNRKFGEEVHSFAFNWEAVGNEQLNMVGEEPATPMLIEAKLGSGSFESWAWELNNATVSFTEAGAEAEFKE